MSMSSGADDGVDSSSSVEHDGTFLGRLGHRLFGNNERVLKMMDDSKMEQLRGCEDLDLALEDCRRVRDALTEARRSAAASAGAGAAAVEAAEEVAGKRRLRMEETAEGMKISRYFGWGVSSQPTSPSSTDGEAAGLDGGTTDVGHDIDRELQELHTSPPSYEGEGTTAMTFGTEATGGRTALASSPTMSSSIPSCSRENHAVWACRGLALGCGKNLMDLRDCFRSGAEVEAGRMKAKEDRAAGRTYDEAALTAAAPNCKEIQEALAVCVEGRAESLERRVRARRSKEEGRA